MAKQMTTHAAAAKAARALLRAEFPSVTFKVTSKSYTGGSSLSVRWEDGPTTRQVDWLISRFQYGSFDGMVDLYTADNRRDDVPQVKYVHTQRDMSDAMLATLVEHANTQYGYSMELNDDGSYIRPESDREMIGGRWGSMMLAHLFQDAVLVCRPCGWHAVFGDAFCAACGAPLVSEALAA